MSSPSNNGNATIQSIDDLVGKMYIVRHYALLHAPGAIEHVMAGTRLLLLDINIEWRDVTIDLDARVTIYFKLMLPSGNIAWWIHQTMLETELEIRHQALLRFLEWAGPISELG